MELTRRQKDFFNRFLALYEKEEAPLHYTIVARHLGVGKVTAYEMLRSLEKKGLIKTDYVSSGSGPGRAQVVFSPTGKNPENVDHTWEASWKEHKDVILQNLRDDSQAARIELRDQLMARTSKLTNPAMFITNMVTALLISIPYLKEEYRERILASIRRMTERKESLLSILPGITLALLGAEIIDHGLAAEMVRNIAAYHEYLATLPAEQKTKIAEFVEEVLMVL